MDFKRMSFYLSFVLSFNSNWVKGQALSLEKHSSNIIDVSFYDGLTLNNLNITHNGTFDPMQAPSAVYLTQKFTIDFQRRTKGGFIYGGGVGVGSMRQEFDIDYPSFSFVDTFSDLKSRSEKYEYRNKSGTFGVRLFIGYSHSIHIFKKNATLEGKFLINPNYYLKGGEVKHFYAAGYISNDTTYIVYKVSELAGKWGKGDEKGIQGRLAIEMNIGLRKKISAGFCNNLYAGIYASGNYMVGLYKGTEENSDVALTNGHYLNRNLKYYTQNFFSNRDFTIGVKLGLGLKL